MKFKDMTPLLRALLGALSILGGILLPSLAWADAPVSTARFGQRYITVGFTTQPGVVLDEDEPPTSAHREVTASFGNSLKLGLHHLLHPRFTMSAEADLGLQWIDDHTVARSGVADSERAIFWQLGLMGRFIPSGDLGGLSLGMGMHMFHAGLDDAPVRALDLEARVGWLVWQDDNDPRFVMLELGWGFPFVSGFKLPEDFGAEPMPVDNDWSWSRGVIAIQTSF